MSFNCCLMSTLIKLENMTRLSASLQTPLRAVLG
jgi:hypothetical protein